MHKLLRWPAPEAELPKVKTFKSTDAALEFAEDELLKSLGCMPAGKRQHSDSGHIEIFKHLDSATRETLLAVMQSVSIKRKKIVYAHGEHGDTLYFILKGQVEIRLPTRIYHYKRLSKLGPGSFFGEVGFLDPGPRTAAAVVTQSADLLALNRESFDSLKEERYKEATWAVLREAAESTSRQLRWSQSELRRLERW